MTNTHSVRPSLICEPFVINQALNRAGGDDKHSTISNREGVKNSSGKTAGLVPVR